MGKETLNPAVLGLLQIGLQRAIKYMQTYYIDDPFCVDRSEKKVPLTKILASSMDRKQELRISIDTVVSLVANDLDKVMDTHKAGEHLRFAVEKLNEMQRGNSANKNGDSDDNSASNTDDTFSVDVSKLNKGNRVKKLIELRKEYFKRDLQACTTLENDARTAFDKKYPSFSSDDDNDWFESKLYQLHEDVLKLERYS